MGKIFWGSQKVLVVDFLPARRTIDLDYYSTLLSEEFHQKQKEEEPKVCEFSPRQR